MAGSSILLFAACLLSPRPYAKAAEHYKTCLIVANCTSLSAPYCQTIFAKFHGTNTSIKVTDQGNGRTREQDDDQGNGSTRE